MKDLIARRQDEDERLTVAIANGFAISMSQDAATAWNARRVTASEPSDAIGRQRASMVRLAQYFPGAVKAKAN